MLSEKTLAAAMLLVAPAASAQSLINGQEVRYNFAYRCKGERVIIAHCRDGSDSSYCQMVYPDRPYVNGMQVAPVEMRGDVIAKLNACSGVAGAPAPRGAPARTSSAKAGSGGMRTSQAPGVGKASWSFLAMTNEMAMFFTRARLKRSGNSASGWFTFVYPEPKDLGGTIKDVQFMQEDFAGDCAKGTFAIREGLYFDSEGKLVTGALLDANPQRPKAGTFPEAQLNIVCGRPQKLFVNKTIDNIDGPGLAFIYQGFLHQK